MISPKDEELISWAKRTSGVDIVSLTPPGEAQAERSVNLYLFELVDRPPLRGQERPPLQIGLRYLVTAHDKNPEDAHDLLGQLVIDAMQNSDYEAELAPPPPALWAALGVMPQPCFILQTTLKIPQPQPEVKPVLEQIRVEEKSLAGVSGRVVSPAGIPVVGATVELRPSRQKTRTDQQGQFHFPNVPITPPPAEVWIKAKGYEQTSSLDLVDPAEEIMIEFDPLSS